MKLRYSMLISFSIALLFTNFVNAGDKAKKIWPSKSKAEARIVVNAGEKDDIDLRNLNRGPVNPDIRRDDQGGPDDFGYRWIDSNEDNGPEYEWIEINEIGERLDMSDDESQGPFEIGFDFPFYEDEFDELNICSNGFITFGNAFNEWDHMDAQFPQEAGPYNVIAPLWIDLDPSENEDGIYYWTDEDQTMMVVEWDHVTTYDWDEYEEFGPKTFELIIYPNGRIIFQYADENVPMVWGVIGIQNEDGSIGLSVAANEEYLEAELAVRIMADAGILSGTVTDLETNEPIEGALITMSDGTTTETDENGNYTIPDIGVDFYTAIASAYGYNPVESEEFEIVDEEETVVDFALPHPEIAIEGEIGEVILGPEESADREFTILNGGNGPLDFDMGFALPQERDNPGDVLFVFAVGDSLDNDDLLGVATDGNMFYLTATNDDDTTNIVYILNRNGEFAGSFNQPVEDPSRFGMRGITLGGDYLYSADGSEVIQFTTDGEAVGSIETPVRDARNLAYDPATDHLWVADRFGNIYSIDLDGNVIQQLDNDLLIYGLAWHPADAEGFNLYVFYQADENTALLNKIDPESGETRLVLDLMTEEEDESRDIAITNGYNPLVWLGVALVERGVRDYIVGFELELNSSWIDVDPMEGTVDQESSLLIELTFMSGDMDDGDYTLLLQIESNAAGDIIEIPLSMTVNVPEEDLDYYDFHVTEVVHEFTISEVMFAEQPAEVDDEIGIFTPGGLCVGGAKWLGSATVAPAYMNDPETDEIDGFSEDEIPVFRVWDRDAEEDGAAVFTVAEGDSTFQAEGVTTGSLLVPGDAIGNDQREILPFDLYLAGAYPNPFNNSTEIRFGIPVAGIITLDIYDLNGRRVDELVSQRLKAGHHAVVYHADNLVSGVYILRLQTAAGTRASRITLIR